MQEELQGKWSKWISNEGNQDSQAPNINIAPDTPVQVIYKSSDADSGTVDQFAWNDYYGRYCISLYRYWIPDTETQTEPKTEKDLYVNIWTDRDEEVLKELLAKKGKADFENKAKLAGLLIKINHQSFYVESNKVDEMIKHADELIDALQPYRKQK
jgi:hypothetical protein